MSDDPTERLVAYLLENLQDELDAIGEEILTQENMYYPVVNLLSKIRREGMDTIILKSPNGKRIKKYIKANGYTAFTFLDFSSWMIGIEILTAGICFQFGPLLFGFIDIQKQFERGEK